MKSGGKYSEKPEVDMTEFPFYDAPDTATIICCHIMENEAKLVSLKWVLDYDNSIGVLKDMPCGYYADRKTQDDDWVIS